MWLVACDRAISYEWRGAFESREADALHAGAFRHGIFGLDP